MFRRIDATEIIRTAERLQRRIGERFPDSGLANVALGLVEVARDTSRRAEANREPILALRAIVVLLLALIAVALIEIPLVFGRLGEIDSVAALIQVLEPLIGIAFFLSAFVLFLTSLESRIKRQRTMRAIHELRSFAHVVDMHQLTKDPVTLIDRRFRTASSPERTMTPFELARYLDYCSEMLALLSKIAALYVQEFPDHLAVSAVDEIENLTTGLARKIWQKVMMLPPTAVTGEA